MTLVAGGVRVIKKIKKTPCVGETVGGNLWTGSHKEETVCTAGALFLAPSQRRQPLPPLVRNELRPL